MFVRSIEIVNSLQISANTLIAIGQHLFPILLTNKLHRKRKREIQIEMEWFAIASKETHSMHISVILQCSIEDEIK